ncbi:MAG: hypothetical protein IH985_04490 [Planctomycetes bacterium]|nr:hypothetical protein [Planctomycetota bacterium]
MRHPGIIMVLASLLMGCAAGQPMPPTFSVAEGQYAAAFDAARRTLRDMRFELDRVDARRGIISTHRKHSAGLATPWDREQSSLSREWEDFANHQFRTVRIIFEPVGAAAPEQPASPTAPSPALIDLRGFVGPFTGTVIVVIERRSRPNRRIDTTSIRLSTFARDPINRGGTFTRPIARDEHLEGRLAARIQRRLAAPR